MSVTIPADSEWTLESHIQDNIKNLASVALKSHRPPISLDYLFGDNYEKCINSLPFYGYFIKGVGHVLFTFWTAGTYPVTEHSREMVRRNIGVRFSVLSFSYRGMVYKENVEVPSGYQKKKGNFFCLPNPPVSWFIRNCMDLQLPTTDNITLECLKPLPRPTKISLINAYRERQIHKNDKELKRLMTNCDAPYINFKCNTNGLRVTKKVRIDYPLMCQRFETNERMHFLSHKVGVLLQREGQKTEQEILGNEFPTENFKYFYNHYLGTEIELKGFKNYNGGLDVKENLSGTHSVYDKIGDIEMMYHLSTHLKHKKTDPGQIEKKRHIGNDNVVILFQDGPNCEIEAGFLPSQMIMSYIVVQHMGFTNLQKSNLKEQQQPTVNVNSDFTPIDAEVPEQNSNSNNETDQELLPIEQPNSIEINIHDASEKSADNDMLETLPLNNDVKQIAEAGEVGTKKQCLPIYKITIMTKKEMGDTVPSLSDDMVVGGIVGDELFKTWLKKKIIALIDRCWDYGILLDKIQRLRESDVAMFMDQFGLKKDLPISWERTEPKYLN